MKLWHAIEVEIARVAETAATTQLWACGPTGIEISEDVPGATTLRAYFELPPDAEKLRGQIVRALRLSDLPDTALRRLEHLTVADQDWLSEWKKGYEPITVGERLLITPSWQRAELGATDRIVIQIDPGMAFGTGTHETTRGCLEMIEKYWRGGALLDVGTGTGILAIAAAKLAAAFPTGVRVVAIDIDPEAIIVAEENAVINEVADALLIEVNRLAAFQAGDFDVVVANLTADVITPLAAAFARALKPGGTLIVSGILREQGDDIMQSLTAASFIVGETKPNQEWITFALRAA